ncbi:MAG: hypothetical protein IT430_13990 [Phycisphaerales bacterium]|nr:hypothetical protein [Phycisphaerales bacterium]
MTLMQQSQTRDGITIIDPLHQVSFGEPPEIQGFAFDPGGGSAILHLHGPSIDLWDVLLHFNGHAAGIVGGLGSLLVLIVIWRRYRHPQQVGRRYCRKCNYDVSEQFESHGPSLSSSPARCPECGSLCDRRGIRLGQTLARRLLVPVGFLLLLAAGSGTFYALRQPLRAAAADWFSWPSAALTERSQKPKWAWLTQFKRQGDVLMRFDLATGTQTQMLYGSDAATYGPLIASSDFSVVYLAGWDGPVSISTRDGRVVDCPDSSLAVSSDLGAPLVVHQEPETGAVYCFGLTGNENVLLRWNTSTGRITRVFGHTAYEYRPGEPVERTLQRLAPGGPAAWLSAPTFMESYNRKQAILYLLDEDGKEVRSIDLGESIDYGAYPAVTADGTRAFFPTTFGNGVRGVDLTTGESLGVLRLPGWAPSHTWCVILSPGGRYLFVANDSVWVRDTSTGRWVARLNIPSNLYGIRLCVSPDGRWLGATAQRDPNAAETAPGLQYAHDLVIWDLSSLPIDSRP